MPSPGDDDDYDSPGQRLRAGGAPVLLHLADGSRHGGGTACTTRAGRRRATRPRSSASTRPRAATCSSSCARTSTPRATRTRCPAARADLLPDPHPAKAPNELRVVLVRARGSSRWMRARLSKATTSDPRCVLKLSKGSDETFTSATRWKSLNPVWLERFGFLCDDTAENVLRNECCLEVTVEDVDEMSGNDFMGLAKVPIAPLADHEPSRAWHKLLSRKGAPDKERGELELFARWLYNPLKDESLLLPEEDESCFETPEQMAAFKPNELIVVLVRARGLLAMDGPSHLARMRKGANANAGSSDPFVRFVLLGARDGDTTTPGKSKEKHRSKVIRASVRPRWEQRFTFGLTHAGAVLRARVYDHDDASSPDFMGRCDVRCGGFNDRRSHRSWFRLTDDSKEGRFDKQRGELEIVTRWHYTPERVTDGHIPVPEAPGRGVPEEAAERVVAVAARAQPAGAGWAGLWRAARQLPRQEEGGRERRRRRPRGSSDPVVTLKIVGPRRRQAAEDEHRAQEHQPGLKETFLSRSTRRCTATARSSKSSSTTSTTSRATTSTSRRAPGPPPTARCTASTTSSSPRRRAAAAPPARSDLSRTADARVARRGRRGRGAPPPAPAPAAPLDDDLGEIELLCARYLARRRPVRLHPARRGGRERGVEKELKKSTRRPASRRPPTRPPASL